MPLHVEDQESCENEQVDDWEADYKSVELEKWSHRFVLLEGDSIREIAQGSDEVNGIYEKLRHLIKEGSLSEHFCLDILILLHLVEAHH